MTLHARSLLLLAAAVTQIYGAIYDRVSQLPTYTYDYIIVGGTLLMSYLEHGMNSLAVIVRRYRW